MGILSKLASFSNTSFEGRQMDEDMRQKITEYNPSGTIVKVQPYPENPGIQGSVELLEAMHNVQTKGRFRKTNTSPVHAFEIWYDENKVQFLFYIKGDETEKRKFLKQLSAHFENADVTEVEDPNFHFPKIEEDEWVAGGRLHLQHHYFEPIRHRGGVEDIREPYKPITNDMVTKSETRMVMQVCFKPAQYGWTETYFEDVKAYAEKVEDQEYVSEWFGMKGDYVGPPGPVRSAASNMKNQSGQPGYHINVRLLSIGPTKHQAERQCKSVSEIFQQKFYEPPGQTLVATPTPKKQIPLLLDECINRTGHTMKHPKNSVFRAVREKSNKWTGRPYRTMIMTIPEVAGLVHIPNEDVKNGAINWSMTDTSGSLPADAPTFEDVLSDSSFDPTQNKSAYAGHTATDTEQDEPQNEPQQDTEPTDTPTSDESEPIEAETQTETPTSQPTEKQDPSEGDVEETVEGEDSQNIPQSPEQTTNGETDGPPQQDTPPEPEEFVEGDTSESTNESAEEQDGQTIPKTRQAKMKAKDPTETDEKLKAAIEDPLDIALRF